MGRGCCLSASEGGKKSDPRRALPELGAMRITTTYLIMNGSIFYIIGVIVVVVVILKFVGLW